MEWYINCSENIKRVQYFFSHIGVSLQNCNSWDKVFDLQLFMNLIMTHHKNIKKKNSRYETRLYFSVIFQRTFSNFIFSGKYPKQVTWYLTYDMYISLEIIILLISRQDWFLEIKLGISLLKIFQEPYFFKFFAL